MVLVKHSVWQGRVDRAQKLLAKFRAGLVFLSRFMYGLRIVIPFVIGMSTISRRKFLLLNGLSALIWAVVFGIGGYLIGKSLEILMGDIRRYEWEIMGVVAVIGISIWLVHLSNYIKNNRKAPPFLC